MRQCNGILQAPRGPLRPVAPRYTSLLFDVLLNDSDSQFDV
ncbi:hypothetical protein [Achromobacter phage kuwaak_TL2]|nr:hypothetical protein [Achromobacter phage kuwaak_TL2]